MTQVSEIEAIAERLENEATGPRLREKAATALRALLAEREKARELLVEWSEDYRCGCKFETCMICQTQAYLQETSHE